MAAPHVAGVAALIISRTASKRMTPAQVTAALVATASPKACPKRECRFPPDPHARRLHWPHIVNVPRTAAMRLMAAARVERDRPSVASTSQPAESIAVTLP